VNTAGIYSVKFYVNGLMQAVIVDSYVPCVNNEYIGGRTVDNEIWVIIIEKAWAKLHGSYQLSCSKSPEYCLIHLLGMPT
jgi:Calpain family cysteine protease